MSKKIIKYIKCKGLLSNEMYHPRTQHIKATLFWRNKPIWEGNYNVLHEEFGFTESVSPRELNPK